MVRGLCMYQIYLFHILFEIFLIRTTKKKVKTEY